MAKNDDDAARREAEHQRQVEQQRRDEAERVANNQKRADEREQWHGSHTEG